MPDGTTQAQFTADRLTGLGGSDLGAILGLNPYRTPFSIWLEKTGRLIPEVDGIHLRHGQWNEQFIADEYTRATGLRTQRYNAMLRHHIQKNADGSLTHQPVAGPEEDCICLAITDAPLKFRSRLLRLVQPFLGMLFAVPLLGERLDAVSLGFGLAVMATVLAGRRMPVRGKP